MEYELKAQSSDAGFYAVSISDSSGKIRTSCSCLAYHGGSMCKHRLALLTYSPRGIFYAKDNSMDNINGAIALAKKYDTKGQIEGFDQQIKDIEKQFRAVKREIKDLMYSSL